MSYCYLVSTLWKPGQVRAANNCRQGPHPQEIESCGNDPASRWAGTDQRGRPVEWMVLGAAACPQLQRCFLGRWVHRTMLKTKARRKDVLLRKQHCTNSDRVEWNLRILEHNIKTQTEKKGTPLSKAAQNPWAGTSRAYVKIWNNITRKIQKNPASWCHWAPTVLQVLEAAWMSLHSDFG